MRYYTLFYKIKNNLFIFKYHLFSVDTVEAVNCKFTSIFFYYYFGLCRARTLEKLAANASTFLCELRTKFDSEGGLSSEDGSPFEKLGIVKIGRVTLVFKGVNRHRFARIVLCY